MTGIIQIAQADCGTGKTDKLAKEMPILLEKGCVLIASPTKKLCMQIKERILNHNNEPIEIDVITGDTIPKNSFVKVIASKKILETNKTNILDRPLHRPDNKVVIITQKAFMGLDPDNFHDWVIVLDELPDLVEMESWSFNKTEMELTISNMIQCDEDKVAHLKITKSQADTIISDSGKALGDKLKEMLKRAAERGSAVKMFNREDNVDNGATFHYVGFQENVRQSFLNASEVHILTATYENTLTDKTIQFWQFQAVESYLRPENPHHSHTDRISIYYLLPDSKKFSTTRGQESYSKNGKTVAHELIQKARGLLVDDYIYCSIKWMNKDEYRPIMRQAKNVLEADSDSRGDNSFLPFTKGMFFRHCNPDPKMNANFRELEAITSIPESEWRNAWDITNTYEPVYQLSARTAIRKNEPGGLIEIIVPDIYQANYLKSKYPEATIEEGYEIELPEKVDNRKNVKATDGRRTPNSKKQKAIDYYKKGVCSYRKIAALVTEISREKVKETILEWQQTLDYYFWLEQSDELMLESVCEEFEDKLKAYLQEQCQIMEELYS